MLEAMAVAFAAFAILGLLFHSIFLGLSTHNAAGLGADPPYLSPYRAGMCWWSLVWAQLKIAIGLIVPAVLIWKGYALPGLIVALIAVELGQRRLDDPFGWLTGPSRHISHLFAGLGVSGSSNTLLGRAWSACFVVSNALFILVCALPLIGLLAVAAAGLADRMDLVTWPTSGLGPIQLALAALAALLVLTTSAAIGLLVPVSIEMVERQRTRLGLLRAGRARPWIARPGYGSAPARDYGPTRYDPDGREAEGPSQASLNSPSTTSSFPWEEEDVSEESPPD
jgi:hypothetical protein